MNTWKTKDGQLLQIKDMETSHIQNCIRMLNRNIPQYPWLLVQMDDTNAIEEEYDRVVKMIEDQIGIFEAELESRGKISSGKVIKD